MPSWCGCDGVIYIYREISLSLVIVQYCLFGCYHHLFVCYHVFFLLFASRSEYLYLFSVCFRGMNVTELCDISLCFVYQIYLSAIYACTLLHSITACVCYVCMRVFMQDVDMQVYLMYLYASGNRRVS